MYRILLSDMSVACRPFSQYARPDTASHELRTRIVISCLVPYILSPPERVPWYSMTLPSRTQLRLYRCCHAADPVYYVAAA